MTTREETRRRGTALILYTLLLPTILMMVGLAIDLGMLYVIQTRLSAATDGAALGAGRLLGTNANTREIATEFLKANFPSGYWGTVNLTPNVIVTNTNSLHTIQVDATVQAPLLFLQILNRRTATIGATATAIRRDVRVELALDRSGSMVDQIPNLITAANNFVSLFHPGTDQLGLVVFGGSALVAYPTVRPYSLTAGNGPDVHFADTPGAGQDNINTMISAISVAWNTNTSEALWLAYNEIKKAQAIDHDTSRMNVIVLFTDGLPNGFTAYVNDPAHNSLKSTSGCTYNPATAASNQIIGWMASSWNGAPADWVSNGTNLSLAYDNTHTAKDWVSLPNGLTEGIFVSGTPVSGTGCGTGLTDLSGLAIIRRRITTGTARAIPRTSKACTIRTTTSLTTTRSR